MKAVGVIPARFGSTRFPGKPLEKILGKPLLSWVIEGVQKSEKLNDIIVATDHEKIAELAKTMGVQSVMTDPGLPSGTDRCFAATKETDFDVILNIQGDEPLIEGSVIDELVSAFAEKSVEMATLGRSLKADDLEASTTAKIVVNQRDEALYFSRLPIPYTRETLASLPGVNLKHVGLYGFRKSFLAEFCNHGVCDLEKAEGLEQLRALYMGGKIKVVRVETESWGVDTPEDVLKIEEILKSRGLG